MDASRYLKLRNNCDENDPLLSATPLGQYLDQVALDSLEPSDLTQLNQALNVEQLICTKSGLARDYRGLAELLGYNTVELEARFKRSYNPTKCLVDALKTKQIQSTREGSDGASQTSVTDLIKLIEQLERFDILDDLLPTLIRIVNNRVQERAPLRLAAETSDNKCRLVANLDQSGACVTTNHNDTQQQRPQLYDAFICYAPEDIDYAQDVIEILERNNKRIVTVDNLLAGQFEFDALVQMIAVECRKVIIILTPNFLKSRDCEFQTKFANEIAIKSGWFPKIIPILYELFDDAQLPPLIRVISKIDMTRANQRDWQLKKLLGSLDLGGRKRAFTTLQSAPRPDCLAKQLDAPADHQLHRIHRMGEASWSSTDRLNASPLVHLAYSESSSANLSCDVSSFESQLSLFPNTPSPLAGTSATSTPQPALATGNTPCQSHPWINWYRSFKRKVRGNSQCSVSPSSRNILLPDSSSYSQLNSDSGLNENFEGSN